MGERDRLGKALRDDLAHFAGALGEFGLAHAQRFALLAYTLAKLIGHSDFVINVIHS
jgi:hypothetical protein